MSQPLPEASAPLAPHCILLRHLCDGEARDASLPAHTAFMPMWPGVDMAPLYGFDADGKTTPDQPAAALIRYAPGASVPTHVHPGYEHVIVLDGSQRDEQNVYPQGCCTLQAPGTQHRVWSDEGCLVLAIWNRPVSVK